MWLKGCFRRKRTRDRAKLHLQGSYEPPEPCWACDESNTQLCTLADGHEGPHSWQKDDHADPISG